MIPRKLLKNWVFALAAVFGAAGLGAMLAHGELVLAMYSAALGLLLGMWGVFLHTHSSRKTITFSLLISACALLVAISLHNHYSSISPITKSIAVYEMNAWGRNKMWKGTAHASINLLTHPSLEAETQP